MQVAHYLYTHFDLVIQVVLWALTLILASNFVKEQRYKSLLQRGVAFAEQYKKTAVAMGSDDPPGDVLKQMAIDYVTARFPGVNLEHLGDDIEAAVSIMKMVKAPAVQFVAGQLEQVAEVLHTDPTSIPRRSRKASVSNGPKTEGGG